MTDDLFLAILAMDAYNRGDGAGLILPQSGAGDTTSIGTATVGQQAQNDGISFFAQSYVLENGQTVISYRGTDNIFGSNFLNGDLVNGWFLGGWKI
jgi:hypothetical protein